MENNKRFHKVISCGSYGDTGSSVITDLLKEFKSCNSLGDYEFRFIQDYDGISTLECALVDNYHRMNSDIAINRFKYIIDYHSGNKLFPRYEKFFKGKFKPISYEYINSLVNVSWRGYWEHHAIEQGKLNRFLNYKIYPRIKKLLRKPSEKGFVLQPPKRELYFSYPKDKFYEYTRDYTRKLINSLDEDFKHEYMVLDQLVPPTNINRYLNYFDDIKVIVVDRDPRDLYIANEVKCKESWIPSHDIDKYIEWYKLLRQPLKTEKDDTTRILRVNFEDMVANYDEYLQKVMDFIGLEPKDHVDKKKYFNPAISINNMRLYKQYKDTPEIKAIERELKEYCWMGDEKGEE